MGFLARGARWERWCQSMPLPNSTSRSTRSRASRIPEVRGPRPEAFRQRLLRYTKRAARAGFPLPNG